MASTSQNIFLQQCPVGRVPPPFSDIPSSSICPSLSNVRLPYNTGTHSRIWRDKCWAVQCDSSHAASHNIQSVRALQSTPALTWQQQEFKFCCLIHLISKWFWSLSPERRSLIKTQYCYSAAVLLDWGGAKGFCRGRDARNSIKLHWAFFSLFLLFLFIWLPTLPFAENTLPSRSPLRNTTHVWSQQGQEHKRRAFSDSRDASLSP